MTHPQRMNTRECRVLVNEQVLEVRAGPASPGTPSKARFNDSVNQLNVLSPS